MTGSCAATNAFDIALPNGSTPDTINRQFDFDEIAHLPAVADSVKVSYYDGQGKTPKGKPILENDLTTFVSGDGRFGTALNGVRVLHGRMPIRSDEIALSFFAADHLGVHAGQSLSIVFAGPEALAKGPVARASRSRIVGIVAIQGGFPPLTGGLTELALLALPNTRGRIPTRFKCSRFGSETEPAVFLRSTGELDRRAATAEVVTSNQIELRAPVQRGLDVEATALRLLGFVVAAAALLLIGQALAAARIRALRRRQRVARARLHQRPAPSGAFARGVLISAVATVVAVVTAALLSALTPVGVAREAELHPGIAVNLAYVGGRRARCVRCSRIGERPRRVVRAPFGAEPARYVRVTTGSRVGGCTRGGRRFDRGERGRAHGPRARSRAVVGPGPVDDHQRGSRGGGDRRRVGLLRVALQLLDEPHLYGWNWDIQVGDQFAPNLRAGSGQARRSSGDRRGRGRDHQPSAHRERSLRHAGDRARQGIGRAHRRRRESATVSIRDHARHAHAR